MEQERKILFLESVQMRDADGTVSVYLLAADGSPFLHVFSPNQVHVRSIRVPARISGVRRLVFSPFLAS